MKRNVVIMVLIFVVKMNSYAQDFNRDMQTVMKNMIPPEGCSSYSMTIRYQKMLESNDSTNALHGQYKFSGKKYSIRMNGVESYQDNKLLVSVNSKEHVMIVNRPERIANLDFNYLFLDSLMKSYQVEMGFRKENATLVYTIYPAPETAKFDSVVIRIDKSKMIYSQVLVCFNESFRISDDYEPARYLIMDYYNYKLNYQPGSTDQTFETSKFVTIRDNRIIPAKAYADYHIVNNMAGPVDLN